MANDIEAAAVARDLFTNGQPRRFAYLVLRDTPGNGPGEGGSWSERAVADRLRAALSAPAKSLPPRYPDPGSLADLVRAVMANPHYGEPWSWSDERAREIEYLGDALAAPAAGDAGAMREACERVVARHLDLPAERRLRDETIAAIRALPLPAPASGAVEEARKAFCEAARAYFTGTGDPDEDRVHDERTDAVWPKFDALLAAEAAERADRGGKGA